MANKDSTSSLVIASSAGLGAIGASLFALLVMAALGTDVAIGGFLLRGLSWAAFVLPAYPWVGAVIIAMPGFRWDLLFALVCSVVPFSSLALTARFLDYPDRWFSLFPGIAPFGVAGLAALGFGLTLCFSALIALAAERIGRGTVAGSAPDESAQGAGLDPEPDYEPRKLELSYPDLPPAPFLSSITALAGTEARLEDIEAESIEPLDEAGALEDVGPADSSAGAEPVKAVVAPDKPIQVMFNRERKEAGLVGSDPALDAEFWEDDVPVDDVPADRRLPSLLPRVEVFQDGEHADAVRDGFPPAKRGKTPRVARGKPVVNYSLPTEGILTDYPDGQYWIIDDKTRHAADVLRDTLKEFGIEAEVTGIKKGPVITMFEILPAPGVRLSKIANLCDNIALRLAASSVRIVAPIPGKHAVGIEVPNERRSIVSFKEIVESEVFKNARMEVPVVLGKDITGDVQVVELTQTPHLLIAGATGSGKSVCVNSIILSILYKRSFNEVKLILIDPKIVELKLYNGIPHLLTPVITEPKRAFQALQYCICEMERRYSLLDAMGVRDIRSFNRKIVEKNMATEKLPYIVVVIDEFADLMATTGKELESTLARLAAMSRAIGIHLVLATQRPSIDVITGLIKANIPSRIAFMVAGKFDSRIIIDMVGAEKLLGRGDMLYSSATDAFPVRMQGAFVSEVEVERVVAYVKTLGTPDYIDEEIFVDEDEDDEGPSLFDAEDDDPLYEKALEIVLSQGKASASFLQRKLKIGYNRAARLVELMEEKGIVGKAQGSKPRDLMHNPEMGSLRPPNAHARYVPDFTPDESEAAESDAGEEEA